MLSPNRNDGLKTRTSIIAAVTLLVLLLPLILGPTLYRGNPRLQALPAACAKAFRDKNWKNLEASAREWTRLQSTPGGQYWLGISQKEQGNFDAAFRAFETIPLDGIRGIDAAIERMELLFHYFQLPLPAIQLADQLLKLDPKLAAPRRNLIYFHAMMLHRAELLRQIHTAIEDHSDLPEHYAYLLTMEDLGFRDAEVVTQKWSEATPTSEVLKNTYLARQIRTARTAVLSSSTPELAARYAALQAEILPQLNQLDSEPIALDTQLLLAMDSGNTEQAGQLLSQVPDSSANDPGFWRYRGWYAMRIGDLEQADEAYRQALELHPLGWQTRTEYASVLRLRGRSTEAAAAQSVAAQGADLVAEIRRLPHAQKIPFELLKRIATYAAACDSLPVANGILRRQQKSVK